MPGAIILVNFQAALLAKRQVWEPFSSAEMSVYMTQPILQPKYCQQPFIIHVIRTFSDFCWQEVSTNGNETTIRLLFDREGQNNMCSMAMLSEILCWPSKWSQKMCRKIPGEWWFLLFSPPHPPNVEAFLSFKLMLFEQQWDYETNLVTVNTGGSIIQNLWSDALFIPY